MDELTQDTSSFKMFKSLNRVKPFKCSRFNVQGLIRRGIARFESSQNIAMNV